MARLSLAMKIEGITIIWNILKIFRIIKYETILTSVSSGWFNTCPWCNALSLHSMCLVQWSTLHVNLIMHKTVNFCNFIFNLKMWGDFGFILTHKYLWLWSFISKMNLSLKTSYFSFKTSSFPLFSMVVARSYNRLI